MHKAKNIYFFSFKKERDGPRQGTFPYSHKKISKILKIANFINFLVKKVVFCVISASVFFQYVKIKKSL